MENQDGREFIVEKIKAVISAPSCSKELKIVEQEYLDSDKSSKKPLITEKLLAELEADVQTIDEVLAFFSSEAGEKFFGLETANRLKAQAQKVKREGGKFCFCPACENGKIILAHKELL